MYKMIVCDLDETLLRKDGSISQRNITAINKASKLGVKFVPNTGRSFSSIQPLLKKINLYDKPNEYVISYNGGAIVENNKNKIIASNEMPFAEASKVFAIFKKFENIDIHVYLMDKLFIYKPRVDDIDYLKTRGVSYQEMINNDLNDFKNEKIMKIIAMNPNKTVQEKMYSQIKSAFNGLINCTYSSGQYLEVNHFGVDKGTASIELGKKMGISANEIIAIGDNGNDVSMLKKAGMPVSVSNGVNAVKKIAKVITKSNYEQGVAEAIDLLIY